jgi:hypothetical protein
LEGIFGTQVGARRGSGKGTQGPPRTLNFIGGWDSGRPSARGEAKRPMTVPADPERKVPRSVLQPDVASSSSSGVAQSLAASALER